MPSTSPRHTFCPITRDLCITGLHRHQFAMRFERVVSGKDPGTHELVLQDIDDLEHLLRMPASNVVERIGRDRQTVVTCLLDRCTLHHADNSLDDIVYVGEVAQAFSVVVELNRSSLLQFLGCRVEEHVRSSPGTVDREEAKPRCGNLEKLAVGMGAEFVALLGCRIQAHGGIGLIVRGEGDLRVVAVDRGARSEDQVFDRPGAAGFEDVLEPDDVALDIHVRVVDAVSNPCLGR